MVLVTDHLDERTFDLLFGIRRSVRYHSHRRRFYEIWNAVTVTVGAIGGSSAATLFLGDLSGDAGWIPGALAGIVAIFSAFDLAVGTGRRADRHGDLARQFIGLEQRFAHGHDLDDKQHEELTRARLQIEAAEPTVLRLLDAMCHYELMRSLGDNQPFPRVPWWRRVLAHCLSQTDYALALGKPAAE